MGEISDSIIGRKCIIGEYSRIRNSNLGNYVKIDRNNLIKETLIGDYSYSGPFDMIFNCKIGKFTSISYGVTLGPPEHDYTLLSTHPFIYDINYDVFGKKDIIVNNKLSKQLIIGNDVWIGCNSTILRDVKVGDGAVIGANSLVNRDVPPYAIVAGCPAKIIKFRFQPEIINCLLDIKWWAWDIEKIKKNVNLFRQPLSIQSLKSII